MNHVPRPGRAAPTGAALTRTVRARAAAAVVAGAVALSGCGAGTGPAPAPSVPATIPAAAPVTATPALGATAVPTPSPAAPSAAVSRAPVEPVTTPAPGSGPTADRAAAETAFRTYLRAVADGDFATACALNAPETNQGLLDQLARQGTPAPTCEVAIATLYAGSGVAQGAATIADTVAVERVDVVGDTATVAWSVEVAGRRPVVTNALRRIDGQWRLLPTPDPTS